MNKKEFDLEVILTIINGVNYTDDFKKVFDLASFVYQNNCINLAGQTILAEDLKQHLLNCLEKELNRKGFYLEDNMTVEDWLKRYINYDSNRGISEELWLASLKSKLGNTLMIEKITKDNIEEIKQDNIYIDPIIKEKVKTKRRTFFNKNKGKHKQ